MTASWPGPSAILLIGVLAATVQDRGRTAAPGPGQGRTGAPPAKRDAPAGGQRPADRDRSAEPEVDLAARYFAICDHDENGWISFAEAQLSLKLDREDFAAYDEDRDGRILPAEFRRRYQTLLERAGAFPAPIGRSGLAGSPKDLDPTRILAAHDRDGDLGLDERELERLIEVVGTRELSTSIVHEKLDRDGSGRLEETELRELARLLAPDAERASSAEPPRTIVELFRKPEERGTRLDSTPLPHRIAGPLPPFHRLDLDGDGSVAEADLIELQRPLKLPVRLQAVFALLDLDRDGRLDEAEFGAAMGRPAQPSR